MCDVKTGDVKEVICKMCRDDETLSDWSKDHRLYSGATLEAAMRCYEGRTPKPGESVDCRWQEIHDASNWVQANVKANFEPSVWFGHAGEVWTKTPDPSGFGHTAGLGKGRVMMTIVKKSQWNYLTSGRITEGEFVFVVNTWCTAGRALIEIESKTARLTLITEDGSELLRMGIQGIDATEAEALELLGRAEMAWRGGAFDLTEGTTKINDK